MAIAPAASAAEAPAGGQSFGQPSYRLYVLLSLTLVYTLNFIDRNLLGVVAQPIIAEFGLSDTQYGFLNGPPFALFYALMGIPIAMAADRFNRVAIISLCIAIWSLMTALCGFAESFVFLLICRIGVAIGEAGGTPPSNSIIGDYFKPRSRAAALGIFAMGVTIGGALANAFGGPIGGLKDETVLSMLATIGLESMPADLGWGDNYGWRFAFIALGLPGVLIALLLFLTVKEPPRGYSDPPGVQRVQKASISETLKELGSKPTFWTMSLGASLVAFVGYGHFGFQAPMAQRVADIGPGQFALQFGLPLALISAVGTFLGGWLTERITPRSQSAVAWIPAVGLLACIPFYIAGFYLIDQDPFVARIVWGAGAMLHYAYLGAQYTIGQGVVSQRSRASAIAILLFIVAIVGNGIGPQVVGILSDTFMHAQIQASGMGDVLTNDICRARDLSALGADQQAVCRAAYGEGLRQSLVAVTLIFIPAALLFLLAARTLPRDMVAKPV
ncbi:MFS transporter [bacterium]|nr:MFS transporter [bacterium]